MAVLSLTNFPDELYERLVRRASDNHRRVDDEMVEAARLLLDATRQPLTAAEKLRLADEARARTQGAWITDEDIRRARDEGRA